MAAIIDLYLEKVVGLEVITKVTEIIVKEAFP